MFTYDVTQLATKPVYQARLLLGDTQASFPLLQDEELAQYLTIYPNVYFAAAYAAEAIAGMFSRQTDRSLAGLSLSNSQKAKQYSTLAAALRRQGALGVSPYAGGQSILDKQRREQDMDRVPPLFTRETAEIAGTNLPEQGQTPDVGSEFVP